MLIAFAGRAGRAAEWPLAASSPLGVPENTVKRKPLTPAKAQAKIEELCRKIDDVVESVPSEERGPLRVWLMDLAENVVPRWWAALLRPLSLGDLADYYGQFFGRLGAEGAEEMFNGVRNMATDIEARVKDHFTAKPRNTARDDEIVRLRDEEGLDLKQIRKRIRNVPEWANGPGGKPITIGAIRTAYHRRKKSRQG
jgi:hypothetical protein